MKALTEQAVLELCSLLKEKKYILLNGGLGVGKTYLAKQVGEYIGKDENTNVHTEVIPIHSAYAYEDFISGMSVDTTDGQVVYNKEDKIFLKLLKSANENWNNKRKKKKTNYLIILDDINRGNITGILGEVLHLLEPHGNDNYTIMINGLNISIPPNFYIIATKNDLISSNYSDKYSLFRRFYHYYLQSNSAYLKNDSIDKLSARFLYEKLNDIIQNNLRLGINNSTLNHELYLLGHGMFLKKNYIEQVKYQCIPILAQYVKEGILAPEVNKKLENLRQILVNNYIKLNIKDSDKIKVQKKIVDKQLFIDEDGTEQKPARAHRPLMNLVVRIKQQGLLADSEIMEYIIENDNVVRTTDQNDGETTGNLFVIEKKISKIMAKEKKGKKTKPRRYYKKEFIEINKVKYHIRGEIQHTDYTNIWKRGEICHMEDDINKYVKYVIEGENDYPGIEWDKRPLGTKYCNDRPSTPPSTILFYIVKNYYEQLIFKYRNFLMEDNQDENIKNLLKLAQEELKGYIAVHADFEFKRQGGIKTNDDNRQANRRVREFIGDLKLLWGNIGDTIDYKGNKIQVEGVYRMEFKNTYREYYETMDALEINQMIIQGPPGTSKTYATKEFLKYMGEGEENSSSLTDEELKKCQITNYDDPEKYNQYAIDNGQSPIAWDIVQFHPSYGYEDFIRGIEVTTKKESSEDNAKSFISYETVNKILGKMAKLAKDVNDKQKKTKTETKTKFFLVVDEINRANLATVFGELIYGLEYRGESVATPYSIEESNKLSLPENLYIIGTMNTADKSIGGIDYAIRRRFLFFSLLPDENVIREYCKANHDDKEPKIGDKAVNLFRNISKLFDPNILCGDYYKEDVQIGHTYFLVKNDNELFKRFKYQIIPILKEYTRDGMFQLNTEDDSDQGWPGFLKCLTGDIKVGRDDEKIKKIYDELITSGIV